MKLIRKEIQANGIPVVYFLGMKVLKYRVISDNWAGYEAQKWVIWYPLWTAIPGLYFALTNTNSCIESAIELIQKNYNNSIFKTVV